MSDRNYAAIRDSNEAIKLIQDCIDKGKPIAFDIEAGYSGPDKANVSILQFHPDYFVVGISFTTSTTWARYIPFAHDDGDNVDNLPAVLRALWRMLQTGMGVAHNAAYELKGMSQLFRKVLWNDPEVGEEVRASFGFFPLRSDTMLEVYLAACYDPMKVGKGLKKVALHAHNLEMTEFADLFPPEDSELGPALKKGKIRFARFNTRSSRAPKVINYACEDSVACLLIHEDLYPDLQAERGGKGNFMFGVEMKLLPVLCRMELGEVDPETGDALGNMLLDWSLIRRKVEEVEAFKALMNEEILQNLSERLGRIININLGSVKQLREILFEPEPMGLGLPIKVRSEKTQEASTSDDALKVIAKSDPIIKRILEYRQIVKLLGSYLVKYRDELNYHPSGRAFPSHNQAGALTGRMSVDQVSYQQWPKPYHFTLEDGTTLDMSFRDLFQAPPNHRIIGFDFSQVELRVLAGMAHETAMLEAFATGTDIHKATAASMMGIPINEVTKKERAIGKTLNFAVVYGSGAANIAEMLTSPDNPVSTADAQEMLNKYFRAFSGLRSWMDARIAGGKEQKEVFTHFGRKFTVWEYYDHREWMRSKGDRMCVNAPVQGGAADYLKLGMVRADDAIRGAENRGEIPKGSIRMVLTIHDALEFYVHEDIPTQYVLDLLSPAVSFPMGLPVEIKADWHEGYQLSAVAEIELDDQKKISGFELVYEIPWTGEALTFAGDTAHEVLDQFYAWEWGFFQQSAPFYQSHRPEFVLPEVEKAPTTQAEVEPEETPQEAPEEPLVLPMEDNLYVRIILSEMPTEDGWGKFQEYLKMRPGGLEVTIETPDGSVTLEDTHALTHADQPYISLFFGGAQLVVAKKEVPLDIMEEIPF